MFKQRWREEQAMKHSPGAPSVRLRRWFFLGWLVIVYLWGTLRVIMEGWIQVFPKKGLGDSFCGVFSQHAGRCVSFVQLGQVAGTKLPVLGALTLCLLGFGVLLWGTLSKTEHLRFPRLSFLLQGILVLITAAVVSEVEMAFVLTLILALEILFLFKQAFLIFSVSCFAIVLFIVIIVAIPPQGSAFWFPPAWNLFGPITTQGLLGLATLLLFVIGYLVVYMQWIRAHAQLEVAHRELEAIHEELVAAFSRIAALTRLTERQRLARDLHDTLAQGLAGLIMQLQVADSYQKEHHYDQTQAILEQTIQRARTTLTEARQTIDQLRHTELAADELKQAIEQERAHFTSSTTIPCEVELGALSVLPPALNEHILYVIKEGLSNIARHAHAQTVWIGVTAAEQRLQIEICDDGIGFDLAAIEQVRGHYGLLGLRERAKLCGGQLEIESSPGEGTRLKLCFPLTGEDSVYDEDHPCRHCG